MVDGVALINNRKGNKRGKTLWVPKGVMRASVEAEVKMNLPDDIEVFQRKASIRVPGFLNPESTFFVRLEDDMRDEIRECDWYLNDDSIAIFDDRKGLHRGKYTNHAESLPLISFYTHENY
jgi:hypothetical protein